MLHLPSWCDFLLCFALLWGMDRKQSLRPARVRNPIQHFVWMGSTVLELESSLGAPSVGFVRTTSESKDLEYSSPTTDNPNNILGFPAAGSGRREKHASIIGPAHLVLLQAHHSVGFVRVRKGCPP